MSNDIDDLQAVVVAATLGAKKSNTAVPVGVINLADDDNTNDNRKRPFQSQIRQSTTRSISTSESTSHFVSRTKTRKTGKNSHQPLIWNGAPDPEAKAKMDIAMADMILSNCMPFTFARDMKFLKCLKLARTLPADYITPDRNAVGGKLLKSLYTVNWQEGVNMVVADSKLFGVNIFGDGATIKTIPMINALAAGVNNPFCLLDVFDCSEHCSKAGKKDASYIAKLFLPLIHQLENTLDKNVRCLDNLYINCIVLFLANMFLSFSPIFRTRSTKVLLISYSLMEHLMSKMRGEFYRQGIHVSQLGMVPNMSPLSSSLMSSPRSPHLRFLQTLQRSFITFSGPQGMSSLPYSISTLKSTTRGSGLASSSHLTAGWLVIKLLYCVSCVSKMHSRLQ